MTFAEQHLGLGLRMTRGELSFSVWLRASVRTPKSAQGGIPKRAIRAFPVTWSFAGRPRTRLMVEFHILQVGDILSVNRPFFPGKSIRKNRHEC